MIGIEILKQAIDENNKNKLVDVLESQINISDEKFKPYVYALEKEQYEIANFLRGSGFNANHDEIEGLIEKKYLSLKSLRP